MGASAEARLPRGNAALGATPPATKSAAKSHRLDESMDRGRRAVSDTGVQGTKPTDDAVWEDSIRPRRVCYCRERWHD